MRETKGRGLAIYAATMLTIAVLLMAAILGTLIFAGIKVKSEANSVTNKINGFNSQIEKINTNLQNIDHQLKTTQSISIPSIP